VKVTTAGTKRVSMAALICTKAGRRPRLIYRIHLDRGPAKERRKGFTETDYARQLDAAHQQLGGPVVLVWGILNTHVSRTMRELRGPLWLTVYQLPPYAPELNPVEGVWSHPPQHPVDHLPVIPPRTTPPVNTRQQRRYPLPRRVRQLTTTHHKINYQTEPSNTGTAGRIENSQVAVYVVCADGRGHAAVDRELYVPRSWTSDPDRCLAAGLSEDTPYSPPSRSWPER
jgi:putative transposase